MKITVTQLARRIERWQRSLEPLGLSGWRIESVSICDETPGGPDADATVITSNTYDSCRFYFSDEFLDDATDRTLDETILHEWLHVAMRDLDRSIHSVADQLAPPAEEQWDIRVGHEREGLIDRLSRQLYAFHSKSG